MAAWVLAAVATVALWRPVARLAALSAVSVASKGTRPRPDALGDVDRLLGDLEAAFEPDPTLLDPRSTR